MGFWKSHFVMDRAAEAKESDTLFVPVKWGQRRKALPLYFTSFGWGFLMTGLVAGGTLGAGMPWGEALKAMFIGNVFLFIVATLAAQPGYQTGGGNNPMYMFVFGKKGFYLPAFFLTIAIMGWQAAITGMTTSIWVRTTGGTAYVLVSLFIGAVYVFTTYRGISGLEKVSTVAIIFLVGVGLYSVVYNVNLAGDWREFMAMAEAKSLANPQPMGLMSAVSVIVGAWIGGSVLGSEFTRFTKTRGVSVMFIFIGIPLCQMFLNILGYIGGVVSGTHDFTEYLRPLGMAFYVGAMISMTFALWTSCAVNLYFPASMVSYVFNIPRKGGVLITGVISTIAAAWGLYNHIGVFLDFLSASLPPLMGPVFAEYFVLARGKWDMKLLHKMPNANWGCIVGVLVALAMQFIYVPSWCPAAIWTVLIGFVVAAILNYVLLKAGKPQGYMAIKHMEQEPLTPQKDDSQYGDFEKNFINYDADNKAEKAAIVPETEQG